MTGNADDWTADIDALLISECIRCAQRWYLPHDRCPNCGWAAHRRVPTTGDGTAAAVTVVRTPPDAGLPFGICLVDLDDGVRVMGRAALTTRVGDRVQLRWQGHQPLFVADDPVR